MWTWNQLCITLVLLLGGIGTVQGKLGSRKLQTSLPKVVSFTLINANTDQPALPSPIKNGDTIIISQVGSALNIRANVEGSPASVVFTLNSSFQQVENLAPFALFGDFQGDYNVGTLPFGANTLTAIPYLGPNGGGAVGVPLAITFNVVATPPVTPPPVTPPPVTPPPTPPPASLQVVSFTLINAATDQPLFTILNGGIVNLAVVGMKLNVRANVVGQPGSVLLKLNTNPVQVESLAPYALFGDLNGDYYEGTFPLGSNTITATPYEGGGGTGAAGVPLTITFTVINGTPPPTPPPTTPPPTPPPSPPPGIVSYTSSHIFTIEDIQGDFKGNTFFNDPAIMCDVPGVAGSPSCPGLVEPLVDKDGSILYPIDSEFGYEVADFLGAVQKTRNNDYLEGFAGNIVENGSVVGVKISNVATQTYKVRPPLGTWCQGLTATAVKCSTEHFSVMEHVLTCHETIPYGFADPVTGEQSVQTLPDGRSFDCTNAELNNTLAVLVNGQPTGEYDPAGITGPTMEPNDNLDVLNNIAASTDYSVTLKDDGKALYRWGSLIKRPTDVRLYARLTLPSEWKLPGANFTVKKAYLVIDHWITNNPNDQIRPEDLENEAATGRKPDYKIENDGSWRTIAPCFEGDADLIGADEGSSDPDELPVGTVLKDPPAGIQGADPPQLLSGDLTGQFTNAWYTTINRDPFEWSYFESGNAANVFKFVGLEKPLTDAEAAAMGLVFVSGPRWRLKANKFGQDLPGLELPLVECSEPPFERNNIKYEVGERTETWINLLDWEDATVSPLATSKGWVDFNFNDPVKDGVITVGGKSVSVNGLPLTNDFDLAMYIKGDKKPTALYSARLVIDYLK